MSEEMVDIADDGDNVIRQATKKEMHEKSLMHRSSNVFVFNSKGELFVHRRARKLSLYPGMHDIKIGGTVKAGESYEDAAKRELEEEAGIKNAELEYLFGIKFRSDRNNNNRKVFRCIYDGKMRLQPEEVESGRFMTVDEAKKMMAEGKLSPSAEFVFKEFLKRTERK